MFATDKESVDLLLGVMGHLELRLMILKHNKNVNAFG